MKREVERALFIIVVILLVLFLIIINYPNNKQQCNFKLLNSEQISLDIPIEELGSNIILESDCLDYAKQNWKNFTFEIKEDTECKISYLRFYKNDPIRIDCSCYNN